MFGEPRYIDPLPCKCGVGRLTIRSSGNEQFRDQIFWISCMACGQQGPESSEGGRFVDGWNRLNEPFLPFIGFVNQRNSCSP